jgi:hypothetical protein
MAAIVQPAQSAVANEMMLSRFPCKMALPFGTAGVAKMAGESVAQHIRRQCALLTLQNAGRTKLLGSGVAPPH